MAWRIAINPGLYVLKLAREAREKEERERRERERRERERKRRESNGG